jgi:hypothetical protein
MHESWIIGTVMDLLDEEIEVMHNRLETFCVILNYPRSSIP